MSDSNPPSLLLPLTACAPSILPSCLEGGIYFLLGGASSTLPLRAASLSPLMARPPSFHPSLVGLPSSIGGSSTCMLEKITEMAMFDLGQILLRPSSTWADFHFYVCVLCLCVSAGPPPDPTPPDPLPRTHPAPDPPPPDLPPPDPLSRTLPPSDHPKFSLFPSPATNFFLSSFSWGSYR